MPKTNTLFSWPGGKTRLLPHLLPLVSATPHTCYAEPFAGGAAVLFAKEPSKVEVLNDTHSELVRLYRVVGHHLDEFMRQFRWALQSREMYRWAQLQHPETLTDIQRAARFFYLQRLAWGGKATGQTFGTHPLRPQNLLRVEEDLSEAHLRLHRVIVENLPWQRILEKYDRPETLFFCDPPYWDTEGYGPEFGMEQYEDLAERLAGLKGRAILTINDHADMRRVFERFPSDVVPIKYTLNGKKPVQRQERIYRVGLTAPG